MTNGVWRVSSAAHHGQGIAMTGGQRHIQRAKERLGEPLAPGHEGNLIGRRREIDVPAHVERGQISWRRRR